MTAVNRKLGFVIMTHGVLGEELLRVAKYIMGKKLSGFKAISVPFMGEMKTTDSKNFSDRRLHLQKQLVDAVDAVDQGSGVIVFTDIMGGTSSNIAFELLGKRKGSLVAGVNLPMILKALSVSTLPLDQATADLVDRSRMAIDTLICSP